LFSTFFNKKPPTDNYTKVLYEMFYNHVYKTAYFIVKDQHLAQDVLQESFLKIFKKISSVEDFDKLKSWITTVTIRTSIDFIRKQNNENLLLTENDTIDYLFTTSFNSGSVENLVEKLMSKEEILIEIEKLSTEHREILLLRYIEDLSMEEISQRLEINIGTVKSRINRARTKLLYHLQAQIDGRVG